METIQVFRNKELAGYLTQTDERSYIFEYEDSYFNLNLGLVTKVWVYLYRCKCRLVQL